ncbi:MAG: hypothetical protein GY832_45425, partial [Chloroflexi bacterium]|nr:hypothetical protein [Chloroflexota bacterium]
YELTWWTVDGGATVGQDGILPHSLSGGTTGQPDAGTLTGNNYTLTGGFWHVAATRVISGTRYVALPPTGSDASNDCVNPGSPCATIQHAINVANPADGIHVAGGTFTDTASTVAEITKTLAITGGYAPGFGVHDPGTYQTVLDARWGGSVVSASNAVSVSLHYLTLTRGDGTGNCDSNGCGGGIYATGVDLYVAHCVITNNVGSTSGSGWGGGIYGRDNDLWVHSNQIVSNTANTELTSSNQGRGGGLYQIEGTALLVENHILDNVAHVSYTAIGGGVYLDFLTHAEVLTNVVRGNIGSLDSGGSGGYYAGGLHISEVSSGYVAANRIENNTPNPVANGTAGGVYVTHSDVHLARNFIISNTAYRAGGIFIQSSTPVTLSNNLIAQNEATLSAVEVGLGSPAGSHALLVNNSIADNGARGIEVWWYATLTMSNNLIAGHDSGVSIRGVLTGSIVADTNLFWNDTDPITGVNAIIGDPRLTADYHLREGSPAVDAGIAIPWLTVDLEGVLRPQGSGYDVGAFEGALAWLDVFLPLVVRGF